MSMQSIIKRPLYDLHCHVLPGMDDGCKTSEESLSFLQESYRQGIRGITATPHYYPTESIEEFLQRREHSIARLKDALQASSEPVPVIRYGAEVAFRSGLSRDPDIRKLCLGASNYLLLELPFRKWTEDVFREIEYLSNNKGLHIMIAHVERYRTIQGKQEYRKLFSLDCIYQINASNIRTPKEKKKTFRLLDKNCIFVLGSDGHNMSSRRQNLGLILPQYQNETWFYELLNNQRDIYREIYRKS